MRILLLILLLACPCPLFAQLRYGDSMFAVKRNRSYLFFISDAKIRFSPGPEGSPQIDFQYEVGPWDMRRYASVGSIVLEKYGQVSTDSVIPFAEAKDEFTLRIQKNPRDGWAHLCRAMVHALNGAKQAGLADVDQFLALYPSYSMAHIVRGNVNRECWDLSAAISDYERAMENPAVRQQALRERGLAFLLQKNYSRAIDDFTEVLSGDTEKFSPLPVQPSAFRQSLGGLQNTLIALLGGEYDKANQGFNTTLKTSKYNFGGKGIPDDSENYGLLYLQRGVAYAMLAEYDKANEDFRKAILKDPLDAEAFCNLGILASLTGDDAAAASIYEAARSAKPSHSLININYAWLISTNVDPTFVQRFARKAIEESRSFELQEKRRESDYWRNYDEMEDRIQRARQNLEAIRDKPPYLTTEELYSTDPSVFLDDIFVLPDREPEPENPYAHDVYLEKQLPIDGADLCYSMGLQEENAGYCLLKTAEAAFNALPRRLISKDQSQVEFARGSPLTALNEAINLDGSGHLSRLHRRMKIQFEAGRHYFAPADPAAFLMRAVSLAAAGAHDLAVLDYEQGLKQDPASYDLRFGRALSLMGLNRHDEALAGFNAASQIRPDEIEPRYKAGQLLALLGRYKEAISQYMAGISIVPNHQPTLVGLVKLLACCPESEIRDGDRAVEIANRVCEISQWSDPDAIEVLALALAEQGQFETAIKWLDAASAITPSVQRADLKLQFERQEPYRLGGESTIDSRIATTKQLVATGTAAARKAEYRRAEEAFKSAIAAIGRLEEFDHIIKDPQYTFFRAEPLARLAWLYSTCPDESLLDAQQALTLAKRAVEIRQADEDAMVKASLAAAHAQNGDFDSALSILVTSRSDSVYGIEVAQSPDGFFGTLAKYYRAGVKYSHCVSGEHHFRQALNWIQHENELYSLAVEEFTLAIQRDPTLLDAYLFRGICYGMMVQNSRYSTEFPRLQMNAFADLNTVLKEDPSNEFALLNRALLWLSVGEFGNEAKATADFKAAGKPELSINFNSRRVPKGKQLLFQGRKAWFKEQTNVYRTNELHHTSEPIVPIKPPQPQPGRGGMRRGR